MGTPDYMAPEQARTRTPSTSAADLYSLGCTLYFLLTGRAPFPGGTLLQKLIKHQLDDPEPIRNLRPEVPVAVCRIVGRMMAKSPDERYPGPAPSRRRCPQSWQAPPRTTLQLRTTR